MAGSRYWIDKQPPEDNGYLRLEGDPGPWIEANSASCLLLRILEIDESSLNLSLNSQKHCDNITKLPANLVQLKRLTDLSLFECSNLTALPEALGQLKVLAYLRLSKCNNLTALPETLGLLKRLKGLYLSQCNNLTALPETLGQLKSLTDLYLSECNNIKSLPASMKYLYHLKDMDISFCRFITELPVDLDVLHLKLQGKSIKFLPKGFTCSHLELYNSVDVLVNSTESLISLQRLTICGEFDSDYWPPLNLKFNPSTLSIKAKDSLLIYKVLASLDELSELMLLDLKHSIIKYLPTSIMKLRKLQTLILPGQFRLESLLHHVNDFVTIYVEGEHVRKTLKELKIEMEPLFSSVSGEVMAGELKELNYLNFDDAQCNDLRSNLSAGGELKELIDLNFEDSASNSLLPILSAREVMLGEPKELNYPNFDDVQCKDLLSTLSAGEVTARELTQTMPLKGTKKLTHLYVDNSACNDLRFPETSTRLANLDFFSNSLDKLSNLETLDITLAEGELPTDMDLPGGLQRLTLRSVIVMSLPASMEKLTKLKALDLVHCKLGGSNPLESLCHTKLKLSYCSGFTSLLLPTRLRHLELLGPDLNELRLEECLNQLETLSITCHTIEYFPSIARPCNLRELRLKDCFKLKYLPPNLEDMVELSILDISGTRIKSLPHSIWNLQKLQKLIHSDWFTPNNLPTSVKKVLVFDDMPEAYYQVMSEYCQRMKLNAGIQGSELQVNAEQGTPHGGNSHHAQKDIASVSQAGFDEAEMEHIAKQGLVHGRNNHHPSENMQNLNPQNDLLSVGEAGFEKLDTEVIAEQESAHVRNNHHPSENSQNLNPQNDLLSVGEAGSFEKLDMEVIAEQESAHGRNNHHPSENSQNLSPQSDGRHKTQRKGISKEMIESCLARNMTLKKAEKELGVSKNTLIKRYKELGYSGWQRVGAKKRKHHNDSVTETQRHMGSDLEWLRVGAKKRKQHNGQPSGNASDQNLVNDQHRMQNHESYNYDAVNNSRHNSTMGTQSHMDGHQHAQQQLGSANECTLSNVMQQNGTSSTFVVKARYKGPAMRFEFRLTNGIAKLYEQVGKRLELDVASFKINYLDEDKDELIYLSRHSSVSDLEHALSLSEEVSEKSGMKVVRLLVVAET